MRVLLLGGVAGPVVFALVVVFAASLRPEYSHIDQFISDLGATGSPHAAIMNYGGFVPAGLLVALFGLALSRVLPREPLVLFGAALVVLFGLGVATSGVVSCDPGCPQDGGSTENAIHNGVAPLAFMCLIIAAGLLARPFRTLSAGRGLAWYSAASSALGTLLLATLASTLETRHMTGAWQRLLLFVLFSWCAVVGVNAYKAFGACREDPPAV